MINRPKGTTAMIHIPTPDPAGAVKALEAEARRREAAAVFVRQYTMGRITVEELRDMLSTILIFDDPAMRAAMETCAGMDADRPCGCPGEAGDPHLSDCPIRTARQDEGGDWDPYGDLD